MELRHQMQWPKDGLFVTVFAHEVFSYRYNWHESDYELNIVLRGKAEFCRGGELYRLEEDDVVLVDPGVGHGSFSLQPNTITLVVHLSANAFKPFLKAGQGYSFAGCVSNAQTRQEPRFCQLRFFAAQLLQAIEEKGPYSALTAKADVEMLRATLCRCFEPKLVSAAPDLDAVHQEAIRRITAYLEQNYARKVTLEELANFTQYNRTYLSTFLKNSLGMNFYEYLTRIRFQHAVFELTATDKTLTEIAVSNGFPDLKTFNSRFRATFQQTPAEYRASATPECAAKELELRSFCAPDDPIVVRKLDEYQRKL